MLRFLLALAISTVALAAPAAEAILPFKYTTGKTLTIQIPTSTTAIVTASLTEGTSSGTTWYHLQNSTLVSAGLSAAGDYKGAILESGNTVGYATIHWSGTIALPPAADLTQILGTGLTEGDAGTLANNFNTFINSGGTATTATLDSITNIKTRTDRIPNIAAGAAGGLFIAGSNAATTVNITGTLSGSVGSISGITFPTNFSTLSINGSGAVTADISGSEVVLGQDALDAIAGVTAIDQAAGDLIAARVLAGRASFYPNRSQVWVLQRTTAGIVVKGDFKITKRQGETLKVWLDFAGLLGRNEVPQTINSISVSAGTATLVADSDGITGSLVYCELSGGTADAESTLSLNVTTTSGQVIEVDTVLSVVD